MTTRRQALGPVRLQSSTHPGLWMDKFLIDAEDRTDKRGAHLEEISEPNPPKGYRAAFKRRRDAFLAAWQPEGALVAVGEAKADGRLIIGLGQKGVMEAGITLDHTWGVPYLPGSALKGLTARAATHLVEDEDWRRDGESFLKLFGTTDEAGAVVFHDAWWKPEGQVPLHQDVMTVHHPEYYQGDGSVPPSDTDSPNPVSFLSVSGAFEVMIEGPEVWVEAALSLLQMALDELGIGAKTNAGYGRASLTYKGLEAQCAEIGAQRAEAELKQLSPSERFAREMAFVLEQKSEKAQIDALLKCDRAPNWIELDTYRSEIYALFGDLVSILRSSIDTPEFWMGSIQLKIAEHEKKKPGKKDKKRNKWSKDLKKLQASLEKAQKSMAKSISNAQEWLDWLGSPT